MEVISTYPPTSEEKAQTIEFLLGSDLPLGDWMTAPRRLARFYVPLVLDCPLAAAGLAGLQFPKVQQRIKLGDRRPHRALVGRTCSRGRRHDHRFRARP